MVKKYAIGILVLVLLVASVYVLYPNNVRIDVGKTYSTFKVWENDSWVLSGQEYSLMFDGTKKMRASSRDVESFVEGEIIKIIRTANFKNNVTVIDTYTFDGDEKDIELFPISHEINVLNGEGYILVYEVTKLEYFGETIKDILSPQEFGHKMKITWEGGNYYSRIWGYSGRDEGKLTVKYRPDSDNFTKQVRLFDPPILEIGYEFINDSVHIWNNIDDYYFNKSSGIQFTNYYEDYWTKNVFCLGYYSGETWVKIKCADELDNFNRNIESDNLTYVNATLWKDINYFGYDLRFGINYLLEVNDTNLSITIYAKNIGIDIPFDLGFAWKIQDVYIPGLEEDYIDINGTNYLLNDSNDLMFKDMNESYLRIHDKTKYLRLDWDNNLNYKVKMLSDNQSNFYVATIINAGHFNPGQEKQTTFQWIDADKLVETLVSFSTDVVGMWGPYWIDVNTSIIVFPDDGKDISFARTTDGGVNWVTTQIVAGTTESITSWFDRETPGDNGNLVHIAWLDGSADISFYVTVDVNDATVGTIRTINDSLNVGAGGMRIALTKTISGNLLVGFETATNLESYRSVNDGVDWVGIADVYETPAQEDWVLLFPANTGDDNDASAIFWDRSANVVSLKMYDDSENDWTETSIASSMIDDLIHMNMDGSVRLSDNHILLAAHSNDDSSTDDLRTWDLTVDNIDTPTVTAKTNIFTDQEESAQVGMIINQQNDDVYVAHLKGGIWTTSTDVVFHKSEDGMGNWGSEQAYSETTRDHVIVHGGRTVNSTGRIQWSFYDDGGVDIYVNLVNDIEIVEAPPDTCTYTSGNWAVDCSDNCSIDSNVDIGGNNLTLNGPGHFFLQANISSIDKRHLEPGCEIWQIPNSNFFFS